MSNHKLVLLGVIAGASAAIMEHADRYFHREPKTTFALTGFDWVNELLAGNPRCMRASLGIKPHDFQRLVKALGATTDLRDSKYITAEEQLAIFLYTSRTGLSTALVKERFQHSTFTIAKYVKENYLWKDVSKREAALELKQLEIMAWKQGGPAMIS